MRQITIILCLLCMTAAAQTSSAPADPHQDSTARKLIEQAIAASAASSEAAESRNFALSGNVQEQSSPMSKPIKILGRGMHDLRVEIALPDGSVHRLMKAQGKGGSIQRGNSTIAKIKTDARIGTDAPFLPLPGLLSDLLKTAGSVTDLGVDSVAGRAAHHLAITRRFPTDADPDGTLTLRSKIDFYIDSANFRILKIEHTAPEARGRWAAVRSVTFDDYREVNGVVAPFLISESIDGQKVSTITVTSLDLLPKTQDSDFQF